MTRSSCGSCWTCTSRYADHWSDRLFAEMMSLGHPIDFRRLAFDEQVPLIPIYSELMLQPASFLSQYLPATLDSYIPAAYARQVTADPECYKQNPPHGASQWTSVVPCIVLRLSMTMTSAEAQSRSQQFEQLRFCGAGCCLESAATGSCHGQLQLTAAALGPGGGCLGQQHRRLGRNCNVSPSPSPDSKPPCSAPAINCIPGTQGPLAPHLLLHEMCQSTAGAGPVLHLGG